MKLGFQGWYLPQPTTGIGQHSLGLLKALAAKPNVELTVVVPQAVKIPGIPAKHIHVLRPRKSLLHPALQKWFWERIQVPAFFARRKLDWEYYPYPSPLPTHSPHRRAMTVHDLILWNDARYQGGRLKTAYHRDSRRALIHVDHIFAVSQSTQKELGIPVATLLPNGLPPLPKSFKKLPYQNDLVYLGGYDLRKRVPELIRAFLLAHKKNPHRRLLLIGEAHHRSKFYPALPTHPAVVPLGKLSDAELYSTLKSAFAFVHFSDSEGFNIPLLQAMAVGLPAVVPDLSVNRELAQDAALYFNPSSKDPLSATLKTLDNPTRRTQLIEAAKKRARDYSWERSASHFLKALHP